MTTTWQHLFAVQTTVAEEVDSTKEEENMKEVVDIKQYRGQIVQKKLWLYFFLKGVGRAINGRH